MTVPTRLPASRASGAREAGVELGVTVESVDEANHSARLAASGRDTKGAGTARANVESRLEPVGPTRTRLHVTSDVQLTGKVASFGRGGAINDVAARLFTQFADCLRATLEAEPAGEGAGATAAGAGAGAAAGTAGAGAAEADTAAAAGTAVPGGGGTAAPADGGTTTAPAATGGSPAAAADAAPPSGTGAAGDGTTTAGAGAAATPAAAAPQPPAPRQVEALDAGSLVGTVIKGRLTALFQAIAGFFRRLFGRRRSRT